MAQDNVFGALADNVERFAMSQYGVDLKDERDQREFAQTGAMQSFITGRIMEPLNARQITPQQAMDAIQTEAERIGLNPKTGLQMFSTAMNVSAEAAKQGGGNLADLLKAQQAAANLQKTQVQTQAAQQAAFLKTPEGIQQQQREKVTTPAINRAITKLETEISELGTRDIEELIDELPYEGLERGLFGAFTNKAETVEQAAEIIARQIVNADPDISADPNAFQIVQARVVQALIGDKEPQTVDTIKKNEPGFGLFHG
jgi:hypothetical protein